MCCFLSVAQVAGGNLAGSLALIADALHDFADVASLVIAFAARNIARRPADRRMTFGYGRIEVLAALVDYTTLILVGVHLIFEGGMRMIDPPVIQGWTVVLLGGVALAVDTLTAMLIWSAHKGSANIRALFLHNLSDALGSVAVIAGDRARLDSASRRGAGRGALRRVRRSGPSRPVPCRSARRNLFRYCRRFAREWPC